MIVVIDIREGNKNSYFKNTFLISDEIFLV